MIGGVILINNLTSLKIGKNIITALRQFQPQTQNKIFSKTKQMFKAISSLYAAVTSCKK